MKNLLVIKGDMINMRFVNFRKKQPNLPPHSPSLLRKLVRIKKKNYEANKKIWLKSDKFFNFLRSD